MNQPLSEILGRHCRGTAEENLRGYLQQAFRSYVPHSYPGQIVLFLSQETSALYFTDPIADWKNLAKGGLVIHEFPGDDKEMLMEPFVRRLAQKLATYLNEPSPDEKNK